MPATFDTAPPATIKVWDLPLRLFHWALVVAIAVAFLSSEEDSALAGWHIAAGWVAAVLLAFRLAWGFVGGEHARFASFLRPSGIIPHLRGLASGRAERAVGHNPAGGAAVLLLLALIAAAVGSGLVTLNGGEEDLHEVLAYLLLGFVGVHVAAVIATSLLTRENLVRAMVTGRKRAALHPSARDARHPSAAGLAVGLGVAASAVGAITQLDPGAFSLQPRETAERGADKGDEAAETGERDEY